MAWPFALVRKAGTNAFQLSNQGLQDCHATIESKAAPHRQAKSSSVPDEDAKTRELLHLRLTLAGARPAHEVDLQPDRLFRNATQSH